MKPMKLTVIIMAFVMAVYLIAYSTSKYWYPNSADGPGALYDAAFTPLNKSSIDDPPYWTDASANNGYLEVYVDWVNLGNGYVYLKYQGSEFRVQSGSGLSTIYEGTIQKLKFTSIVSTNDAFQSSRIVTAHKE